tara:strand:+ start:1169 stop:1846 length:678 start_codon:yes stop_codon:yes gene_type:complete
MKILIHRKGETYGPYDPESVKGFIKEKRASLRDWASLEGSEERVRLEVLLRDEKEECTSDLHLEEAMKTVEELQNLEEFSGLKELLEKLAQQIKYSDGEIQVSETFKNNQDYLQLISYFKDALQLSTVDEETDDEEEAAAEEADNSEKMGEEERVYRLLERLSHTETDVMGYLENFVYDDTEHPNVKEYALHEFGSAKAFSMNLIKGYFQHNFWYYLDKLERSAE